MTEREKKVYAEFGAMVVGMIRDLGQAPDENAYARRTITFPDGSGSRGHVTLIVCRTDKVAEAAENGIKAVFDVLDTTPPSKIN